MAAAVTPHTRRRATLELTALQSFNAPTVPNANARPQQVRAALIARWAHPHAALLRAQDGSYAVARGVYRARAAGAPWQLECCSSATKRNNAQTFKVDVAALERGELEYEAAVLGFLGGTSPLGGGVHARVSGLADDHGKLFFVKYEFVEDGEAMGQQVEVAIDDFLDDCQRRGVERWPRAALGERGESDEESSPGSPEAAPEAAGGDERRRIAATPDGRPEAEEGFITLSAFPKLLAALRAAQLVAEDVEDVAITELEEVVSAIAGRACNGTLAVAEQLATYEADLEAGKGSPELRRLRRVAGVGALATASTEQRAHAVRRLALHRADDVVRAEGAEAPPPRGRRNAERQEPRRVARPEADARRRRAGGDSRSDDSTSSSGSDSEESGGADGRSRKRRRALRPADAAETQHVQEVASLARLTPPRWSAMQVAAIVFDTARVREIADCEPVPAEVAGEREQLLTARYERAFRRLCEAVGDQWLPRKPPATPEQLYEHTEVKLDGRGGAGGGGRAQASPRRSGVGSRGGGSGQRGGHQEARQAGNGTHRGEGGRRGGC